MSNRTVKLTIDAKVSGLQAGLRTAAKATKDSAREIDLWSKKHEDSLNTVGQGMTAFGLTASAGVGLAVTKFASFDKALSGVRAATHETETNMGLLRQAAIDAGADTAFSAEEAARGIEELAKAGVSTQDVIGGGLTGALDLAAAGQLSVAEAAEISASALTQFKLSGEDIPHLADLLAAGAGKAQGSVQDLGSALNQAGLVASSTGLTIEETTGGLAAFASAGLVGSDAGTSFKTMLQRLTPQSAEAQKQFDELGISAYDAQGNFVGLADFAGQLQTKMADLTPEARSAAMSVMFGSDAVRASNVLYEQGAAGIQDWINQVNDAGYAAETAALLTDNLAGDLERLGGSFDTVFIQSGGAANEALRGLVQGAEGLVDALGEIPAPVLGAGAMLAGVAGGAALLGGAAISVIPKIRDTKDALRDLGVTGRSTGKNVGALNTSFVTIDAAMTKGERSARKLGTTLKTVGSGAALLAGVGPAIGAMIPSGTLENIDRFNAGLLETSKLPDLLNDSFTGQGSWMDGLDVNGFEDAMGVLTDPSWSEKIDQSISGLLTLGTRSSSNFEFAKKNVEQLDAALTAMVKEGSLDQAAMGYDQIAQMASNAGVPVEELASLFPQYSAALQLVDAESANAVASQEGLKEALDEVGVSADGVIADMSTYLDLLFATGLATMSSREAQAAYEEQLDSVDAAVKELSESGGKMGATLNKNKSDFDLSTEAGRLANDEFQALARGGMDEVRAMSEEGVGQDQLQKKLSATYSDLVSAGEAFGMTAGDAENLAREVLGIPDDVKVDSWMSSEAKRTAEQTKAAVDSVNGSTAHVWITTHKKSIYSESHVSNGRGGSGGQTLAQGGRARLGSFSGGGRLPATGLGTDMILGVTSSGRPIANVDDREWVINRQSSDKYDAELSAINAGTFPKLPGYADGGQLTPAPAYFSSQGSGQTVSLNQESMQMMDRFIQSAEQVSGRPVEVKMNVGMRQFAHAVQDAHRFTNRHG
ncbi:phage tail tape measure protein [Glutamicibacter sp. FR1]|uniref:phage tail tape measure protein n=1 Tax=Glutamicibacter sp. FR1 TaxID=3393744 RepID=UPI0039AED344